MNSKTELQKLSRRERQIMDILFENGESSAHEIQTLLPDPPGYSAVRALLARLVAKNTIKFRQDGARYLYQAEIDTDTARRNAVDSLLKTFFGNSPAAAVSALLGMSKEHMSDEELAEITQMIADARREEMS